MKTTHDIACELLALPNVPLKVEGWCEMRGHEMVAQMTEYDPEGAAILMQKCVDEAVATETRQWMKDHTEAVWMNIKSQEFTEGLDSVNTPTTSSTHLVDCNSYTGELCEYPTISEALAENRIVEVTKDEDGRFKVSEMCDEWYSIYLTAAQLRVWADELRAMADAPNA
jgi:hypothetical protein